MGDSLVCIFVVGFGLFTLLWFVSLFNWCLLLLFDFAVLLLGWVIAFALGVLCTLFAVMAVRGCCVFCFGLFVGDWMCFMCLFV